MNNALMVFTVQTRNIGVAEDFSTLEAAVAWGLSLGRAFDVSVRSGAIVWAWEMR